MKQAIFNAWPWVMSYLPNTDMIETRFGKLANWQIGKLAGQPAEASPGQPGVLLLSSPTSSLPNFSTYFESWCIPCFVPLPQRLAH